MLIESILAYCSPQTLTFFSGLASRLLDAIKKKIGFLVCEMFQLAGTCYPGNRAPDEV